jgi:hypothetical protein
MSNEKLVGIEELRAAVKLFDQCNESFNWSEHDPFTAEQLLAIYRAHKACKWYIDPDQWTDKQVKQALRGIVPEFLELSGVELEHAHASDTELVGGYLIPVYPSKK